MKIPATPERWYPHGTRKSWKAPTPGDLIAVDHAAWRVISAKERNEVDWTEQDHKMLERRGLRPTVIVLRPANITSDDPRHDKHIRTYVGHLGHSFSVYPSEHYPICAACHEPMPCRHEHAKKVAEHELTVLARYEQAGVCPACGEVVTAKQKRRTFGDNVKIPGGPALTYHVGRGRCRSEASEYEREWAAADPQNRTITMLCTGDVTVHNDGTYDCTQGVECPGPHARHGYLTTCRCPDCHAYGLFSARLSESMRNNALD